MLEGANDHRSQIRDQRSVIAPRIEELERLGRELLAHNLDLLGEPAAELEKHMHEHVRARRAT